MLTLVLCLMGGYGISRGGADEHPEASNVSTLCHTILYLRCQAVGKVPVQGILGREISREYPDVDCGLRCWGRYVVWDIPVLRGFPGVVVMRNLALLSGAKHLMTDMEARCQEQYDIITSAQERLKRAQELCGAYEVECLRLRALIEAIEAKE